MRKLKPHKIDWAQIERFLARGFVSYHDAEEALKAACDYLEVIRADINVRKP
jgi:hypothetical protein